MNIDEDEYLAHYGVARRSGRYPWGSGDDPTRSSSFLTLEASLKKQGLSESEIADGFGVTIAQLRARKTIAKNEVKVAEINQARRLEATGMSKSAIGREMGKNESSIRALLAEGAKEKADSLLSTSEMLKRQVEEKKFLDIGAGQELYLGISKERLNAAVHVLKEQGYEVHSGIKIRQLGTGHETNLKVLAPPGTSWGDVQRNRFHIKSIQEFSDDNGLTFTGIKEPLSIHPDRVKVRFDEEGGGHADGVIYVRPGVNDISLGKNRYAQVRVKVGDDHYLKGMAVYKDDLPKGVDIEFNTNKSKNVGKLGAMKKLEDDPDLPFGAVVRQIVDKPGRDGKVTSAMNIVNEEGDWDRWSRNLSPQMLSKQSPRLAKEQLDLTHERHRKDLDEIKSLTNPTIKKKLLESYADGTDSAAVHLKAAAMPRQASQVIMPIKSLKDHEVYAPNYKNGESVVLIRFPHGGKFEIPELTVNNRNVEARKILADAKDAIGINHKVAQRLSGADFDGDTVLVIPNNNRKVKVDAALEGLKTFEPKVYRIPDDSPLPRMDARTKAREMGLVSNLITDMTIKGAPHSELVRAVRHSMVVIDAEKHELNWKQSALDNGIKQLNEKYQGKARGGASTLISRASSEERIPERKLRSQAEGGPVDRTTGKLVYVPTNRVNQAGHPVLEKVEKLSVRDNAHDLSSGTPMEKLYADQSNRLKSLANEARLEALSTPSLKYSPSAKKAFGPEVASLNEKLTRALMNAPRERQAQVVAGAKVKAKRDANPNLEPDQIKKISNVALEEARSRMSAKKSQVDITPDEWAAIQAGAISNSKLKDILDNADLEKVKELAMPRASVSMTPTATAAARSMLANGYTKAEVAERLGVSVKTMNAALDV